MKSEDIGASEDRDKGMKEKLSFTTDSKLRILSWNKGMESLTGKPLAEVKGIPYYEAFPRLISDNKDALLTVFRTKKPLSLDEYAFNCLHTQSKIRARISPRKDRSGKVTRVSVNITPFVTCPNVKKLDQSQNLINIGKIASTLAHDVRNPLNAIKGAVVYLRAKYSHESTLLEFAQIMEDEIDRLDSFISKFLSSSIFILDVAPTDVNNLIRKIEKITSLQTRMRDIEARFIYGDVVPIMISPFHIEHAILNITNNALDAMEEGGQLTVSTSTESYNDEAHVVVNVSDNGKGIQGVSVYGNQPVPRNNGKGYGLFVTHEILKYFNGRIEIKNAPSGGTVVKLILPCSQKKPEGVVHVA